MNMPEHDLAQRPALSRLPGGLRIRLLPRLRSTQAAAWVRVHAGSHDAPTAYPGLAHFLEHLLFLGSDSYPQEQGLMPFVQSNGGQLNASTRERHTDFFFQVPAELLQQGLLRLLDMLAHPLLDPAMQLREREVLQAEYLARAQDSDTLCDAALGTLLDTAHPFAGFHAGNRDSLPVETEAFQLALRGYHRRFYHAGQIELLLAGPQSAEELQRLSELADQRLPSAAPVERVPAPLRASASWLDVQIPNGPPGLHLCFVLDQLPDHSAVALEYLSCWITSEKPGSLLDRLRHEGHCQALKWREPYRYADQAMVVLTLPLGERGRAASEQLIARVLGWLRYFEQVADQPDAHEQYRRIRQRSLLGLAPLELLRHWVEPDAWSATSQTDQLQQALGGLLRQLNQREPIVLLSSSEPSPLLTSQGFSVHGRRQAPRQIVPHMHGWQLPEPNRWLLPPASPQRGSAADETTLRWLEADYPDGQGALYLRWRFAEPPSVGLWYALRCALQPCFQKAEQAGVRLRFEDLGDSWCLGLTGFAEAFPNMVEDLGALLSRPPSQAFVDGSRLAGEAGRLNGDEMLIRQLLRQLPRRVGRGDASPDEGHWHLDQARLEQHWQAAQRDGLSLGLAGDLADALAGAMQAMPGVPPDMEPIAATALDGGRRWQDVGLRTSDTALLLFCALPGTEAEIQAAWRLLARLMEGDFYRRLRGELQLGYAVFCGFRQLAGHSGILFAVQSPGASAAEILAHIETFLEDFSHKLTAFSAESIKQAAATLSGLLRDAEPAASMERAWQNHLAGQNADYPERVAAALGEVSLSELHRQLRLMRLAEGGQLVIANAPPPTG